MLHAGAPGVDGHDAVEVTEVDAAQRGWRHVAADAGVVEHHVEAAVELDSEVDGRGDLRLVGDVAAGVARGVRAQLRGDSAPEIVLHVGDDDPCTVPYELGSGGLPDAARGTGDDCHLSS